MLYKTIILQYDIYGQKRLPKEINVTNVACGCCVGASLVPFLSKDYLLNINNECFWIYGILGGRCKIS